MAQYEGGLRVGSASATDHRTLTCMGEPDLLPTTYYLLPTTYYLLHTTYCLLPTAYSLLSTTYYLLPTTY